MKNDILSRIKKIMQHKSFNSNPMEFLINILDNIRQPTLLIIDKYKTALDVEYYYLQELLNKFKSKIFNTVNKFILKIFILYK